MCYVADTVRGIIELARSAHHGPVNIGNPDEMSILELAETIRAMTKAKVPIQFVERPVDDPTVRRPDTSLAESLLGWRPLTAREEGLAKTIAWFASKLAESEGNAAGLAVG